MIEIYKTNDNAHDILIKNKANILELLNILNNFSVSNTLPKLYKTENEFLTDGQDGELGYIRTDNGQTIIAMKLPNGVISKWKNWDELKTYIDNLINTLNEKIAQLDADIIQLASEIQYIENTWTGDWLISSSGTTDLSALQGDKGSFDYTTDNKLIITIGVNRHKITDTKVVKVGSSSSYHLVGEGVDATFGITIDDTGVLTIQNFSSTGTTSIAMQDLVIKEIEQNPKSVAIIDAYTKAQIDQKLGQKQDTLSADQLSVINGKPLTPAEKTDLAHFIQFKSAIDLAINHSAKFGHLPANTNQELGKKQNALSAEQLAILSGLVYSQVDKDKLDALPSIDKNIFKFVVNGLGYYHLEIGKGTSNEPTIQIGTNNDDPYVIFNNYGDVKQTTLHFKDIATKDEIKALGLSLQEIKTYSPTSSHQTGYVVFDGHNIDSLDSGTKIKLDMKSVDTLLTDPLSLPEDNAQFFIGTQPIRILNSAGSASLKWKAKTNPTDINVIDNYHTKYFVLQKQDSQWNFVELEDKPTEYALKDLSNVSGVDILLKQHEIDSMTDFTTTIRNIPAFLFEHAYLQSFNAPNAERIGASSVINYQGTTLNLPKTTFIGDKAFANAINLTTINAPLLTEIDTYGFQKFAGTTIDLPKLTKLGDRAFYNAINLTTINAPLLTEIDDSALYNFAGTTIDLPELTILEKSVFRNAKKITTINAPKLTEILDFTFQNFAGTILDFPLVQEIHNSAFASSKNITTIDLPKLTKIDASSITTFKGTTLNLPELVELGSNNFKTSPNLTTIDLPKLTTFINSFPSSSVNLTTLNLPKLTTINTHDFQDFGGTTLTFESVSTIPYQTFRNAKKLETLNLPNATDIADGVCEYSPLTTLSVPKATTIGRNSFAEFHGLVLDLPKLTHLESQGFHNVRNIETLNIPSMVSLPPHSFNRCPLTSVNAPLLETLQGNFDEYKGTTIDLPKLDQMNGSGGFFNAINLTTINFPLLRTMGLNAFAQAKKLATIDCPKVVSIGADAFKYCPLTSVNLPLASTILDGAFHSAINDPSTTFTLPSKFNNNTDKQRLFNGTNGFDQITFTWV